MKHQLKKIQEILSSDIKTVMISGHVNPDGDCVGSCMALSLYLKKNYPELDVKVVLEKPKEKLLFLKGTEDIISDLSEIKAVPDLFVLLDASDESRLMEGGQELFENARYRACIDHHEGSTIDVEFECIHPKVGSCAEVLFELLDVEKIDDAIAEAIFTGIIHDTGVMQYTNTRPRTYEILSVITRFNIDCAGIIYDSFKSRTAKESQILGFCLEKASFYMDGRIVVCVINVDDMKRYEAGKADVGPVVANLKLIQGTDIAIFAYPLDNQSFKISIRTSEKVDATILAGKFAGGGHDRAAGGSFTGTQEEAERTIIKNAMEVMGESC